MQPGTPGVDGTTMSAADQFCIKCQSQEQAGVATDERCICCDTDYTNSTDDNIITYDDTTQQAMVPPQDPVRDMLKRRAGIK